MEHVECKCRSFKQKKNSYSRLERAGLKLHRCKDMFHRLLSAARAARSLLPIWMTAIDRLSFPEGKGTMEKIRKKLRHARETLAEQYISDSQNASSQVTSTSLMPPCRLTARQ